MLIENDGSSGKDASGKRMIVFCPGVGYPHKALQFIPEIAAALRAKTNGHFQFILTIGDGWLLRCIEKKARRLGVTSMVVNQGPYQYTDLVKKHQQANLVFVPSLLETFSASYLEAMAMGKPLVVADRPFARDICQGAALFVDPLDADGSADAILDLYKRPDLQKRLVERGKETLRTYGDQEQRCNHILRILKERAQATE
jgi:glycosyltransferase involved in cell wall biosynthesis